MALSMNVFIYDDLIYMLFLLVYIYGGEIRKD